jgi:hypothetical protein
MFKLFLKSFVQAYVTNIFFFPQINKNIKTISNICSFLWSAEILRKYNVRTCSIDYIHMIKKEQPERGTFETPFANTLYQND